MLSEYSLVWLDTIIDDSNENLLTNLKTFTDIDQYFHFVSQHENDKLILIISDSFDQYFTFVFNLVENMSQVHAIYIISNQKEKYENYLQQYQKVKTIYLSLESMIKDDIQEITSTNIDENKLDKLDVSFIYSKILLGIIFKIEYDENAKNEFVRYCRESFVADNNIIQQRKLDEFERSYSDHPPIWWYTRETFLYSMINKALRILDVDLIIKMGFIIKDVHQHIEQLYSQNSIKSKMIVYRGQGLSNSDFEKLRNSIGGLLSFNNFLSTSFDRDVSLIFAETNHETPGVVGVLFEIEIDPTISSIPFAEINDVTYFDDTSEILFSVHSIFRIDSIENLDDRLYRINLTLTNIKYSEANLLIDCIQNEIQHENPLYSLVLLLHKMGHYDKAREINQSLLETLPSSVGHSSIGMMYQSLGDYAKALAHYEKAFENDQNSLPIDSPVRAVHFNNVGLIYQTMGDYSKALLSYEKAFEIKQKNFPADHPSLINLYNNIGETYNSMGDYSKALSYYEKTLKIQRNLDTRYHPLVALTYNNIGSVYRSLGNYSLALECYKKTLDLERHFLLPDHPSFSTTYNNIGLIYSYLKDYSTALSYYDKALTIVQKSFSTDYRSQALIYNNIGEVHHSMKQYQLAKSYYEKALEIQNQTLPSNHPELAAVYNNIGELYRSQNDYCLALQYFEKTLEIEQKIYPSNHPSLAITYINIAVTYEGQEQYGKAIEYAKKGVDIFQQVFGSDHTKTNEAQVYLDELEQKL